MTSRKASDNEKKIIRLIVVMVSIWATALTLFTALMNYSNQTVKNSLFFLFVICIVSIVSFEYFQERIILFGLKKIKPFSKSEENICGKWRIEIEYEKDGKIEPRIGELDIVQTITGLQIVGDEIRDKFSGATKVETWESEHVGLIETPKMLTIEYSFKIKRSTDRDGEYSKVGHVVASSEDRTIFKGIFTDLLIPHFKNNDDEEKRQGTVLIERPKVRTT